MRERTGITLARRNVDDSQKTEIRPCSLDASPPERCEWYSLISATGIVPVPAGVYVDARLLPLRGGGLSGSHHDLQRRARRVRCLTHRGLGCCAPKKHDPSHGPLIARMGCCNCRDSASRGTMHCWVSGVYRVLILREARLNLHSTRWVIRLSLSSYAARDI
jgi:hypothetical protein